MKRKLKVIGQIFIIVSLVIISFLSVYNYYQAQKDEEMVNDYIEETKIVDEEEIEEIRVGFRYEVVPRDGNRQEEQDSGHVEKF